MSEIVLCRIRIPEDLIAISHCCLLWFVLLFVPDDISLLCSTD